MLRLGRLIGLSGLLVVACGGDEFGEEAATGGAGGSGAVPNGGTGGTAGAVGGSGGSAGVGAAGGAAGSGGVSGGGGTGATGGTAGAGGTGGTGATAGAGGTGGGTGCITQGSKPAPTSGEQVLALTANTGDDGPEYPVLDDTHVYWTTKKTLWRIDKAGACLQQVATGGIDLENVVLDAGYAYVADTGAGKALRVPLTGGNFADVQTGQGPMPTLAVDATHVYWARVGNGVGRRLKDGSGTMEVVGAGGDLANAFAVAVDSTWVWVATRTPSLIRIEKKANGLQTKLDSVTGNGIDTNDPVYIALYANRAYWTHWLNNPDSGGIRSVTTTGTNLVAFTEVHPEGIAISPDGQAGYWSVGYSGSGRIRKGSAALTSASDLASNQDRPRAVAVDATHVYWANEDDDTLRRKLR